MKLFIAIILALSIFSVQSLAAPAVTVSTEYVEEDSSAEELLGSAEETAADIGAALDISAKSAVLLDAGSGKIIYEANGDEQLAPASITKIMSLLLVCEAINNGNLSVNDIITASEYACSMGGSQIWLEPGEQMSVDDLLKACFIASANDATVALAEQVAGSEEAFVILMNKRAAELGCTGTNFVNSTGLDAEGHMTTARDVAIMAAELISHQMVKAYSTVWMDTLRNGQSELVNTNKLVRFYNGCTGLKTGTTSGAGYCLAATAEREGLSLVAVVMGADSSANRFEAARRLLNFGFANYTTEKIEYPEAEKLYLPVTGGVTDKVTLTADNISVLLKKTDKGSITKMLDVPQSVAAPIAAGDLLGCVYIKLGDNQVGIIELRAAEDVKALSFGYLLKTLLYELFRM